jgi:glycosyltransferase involved in cell wall biosynthesis
MKLSIVVPTYNSESTIIKALNSIVEQKKHNLFTEVVIIDDASSDSTMLKIKSYIEQYNGVIKFILLSNQFNQGVSKTRNFGMDNCTGDYIAFLDSDDVFHPEKMSIVENILNNYCVDFFFHSFSLTEVVVNKKTISPPIKLNVFFPFYNVMRNIICTPCVIIKSTKVFRFNEKMSHMEDLELWTDMMLQPNMNIYKSDEKLTTLGHVANEGSGLSSNRLAMRDMELIMLMSLAKKRISLKILFPIYFIIHKLKSLIKN